MSLRTLPAAAIAAVAAPAAAQDAGQLNVICSVQAEWCNMIQTVFAKTTGIKVNMSLKGSGEALRTHCREGQPEDRRLVRRHRRPPPAGRRIGPDDQVQSASLPQLHPWAQQQAQQSKYRTVGIYSGPLGFGYNTELLAKKKLAVPKTWTDLLNPALKGEIQVANPASSGTAYTMVATLVQLMGEDEAFNYMKALDGNISQYTRSGTGPQAAARGEPRFDRLPARRPDEAMRASRSRTSRPPTAPEPRSAR